MAAFAHWPSPSEVGSFAAGEQRLLSFELASAARRARCCSNRRHWRELGGREVGLDSWALELKVRVFY